MTVRSWAWAAVATAALSLAACNKEATGQVAAVVNGEEITLQEINAELGQTQIPEGADRQELQRAALQRIIERRLLAQAARREGVDESPEFLVRRRQLEDALLVQLLGQQAGRTASVPNEAAIDSFMEENPAVFAGRTILAVDRIQFPVPSQPERLRQLEDDHSMEAVASRLRQMGVEFARDNAELDSARLGQDRFNRIQALPDGEPFITSENGIVTVAVVTGSTPRPVDEAQARPAAVQLMRNQALSEAIRQRLDAERASAEIEYQEGFAPSAPSTNASGPTS